VVGMQAVFGGNYLVQLVLDSPDILAGGQSGPICKAKDVSVYGDDGLVKNSVKENGTYFVSHA